MDNEKKIWLYAAIQTLGSPSATQSGVKSALSPSAAPSRKSARTTRMRNDTSSSGRKMKLVRSTPFAIPAASTKIVTPHTATSGIRTEGTNCIETPGSLSCRKSPVKNAAGSSPQPRLNESTKKLSAQAMMAV